MHSNRQSAALAAGADFEPLSDRRSVIENPACRSEEFNAFDSRPRAPVSALEEYDAEFTFEIAQAATEGRLPDVERFRRLSQAPMLRGRNCPSKIPMFDRHG
jgi:hypothetical protein